MKINALEQNCAQLISAWHLLVRRGQIIEKIELFSITCRSFEGT